jgi:hypothetical protein
MKTIVILKNVFYALALIAWAGGVALFSAQHAAALSKVAVEGSAADLAVGHAIAYSSLTAGAVLGAVAALLGIACRTVEQVCKLKTSN